MLFEIIVITLRVSNLDNHESESASLNINTNSNKKEFQTVLMLY